MSLKDENRGFALAQGQNGLVFATRGRIQTALLSPTNAMVVRPYRDEDTAQDIDPFAHLDAPKKVAKKATKADKVEADGSTEIA